MLRVEVADTGPGIAEAELAGLFQPFVQAGLTNSQAEGTGLGLAISRELAELMGGSLTAESDGKSGSVFRLELPAPLATPPLRESAAAPPAPAPRRVLIVDDNDLNRLLGQKLLEREGHSVEVACDGGEALAMIARGAPDVVLMDLQMPGLDGLETTRELRRRGSAVPVIALTANAVQGDRERCLAAGMDGYLPKPLDLAALRATLRGLEAGPA
jgi:CheY-like chemotaxis protein